MIDCIIILNFTFHCNLISSSDSSTCDKTISDESSYYREKIKYILTLSDNKSISLRLEMFYCAETIVTDAVWIYVKLNYDL